MRADWSCYWKDYCPVCGSQCIEGCRCPDNHRKCGNSHHWRRLKDGRTAIEDKNHRVYAYLEAGVEFMIDVNHGVYDDSLDRV